MRLFIKIRPLFQFALVVFGRANAFFVASFSLCWAVDYGLETRNFAPILREGFRIRPALRYIYCAAGALL